MFVSIDLTFSHHSSLLSAQWFLVSRASISAGSPWRNAADTSAEVVTKWVGAVKRAAEDAGVPREWTTWFDTK